MRKHVLAAVAMLLVACGGDKSTGPETVTGIYMLRTVNGASLPAPFYQDEFERDDFFDGSIALAADHSWAGRLSIRAIELPGGRLLFNGDVPVSGTYSLNSGAVTLTDAAHGLQFTGTVGGGTLAIGADLGDVSRTALVFSK